MASAAARRLPGEAAGSTGSPPRARAEPGLRRPLVALAAWAAACFAVLAPHGGIAWNFFVTGSRLLFSGPFGGHHAPGGLHLYANYPSLQIGQLAFAVAEVLRLAPGEGLVAAQVFLSALGLVTVWILARIALDARPDLAAQRRFTWTFLVCGVFFIAAWQELAVAFAHLDDGLALTLTAAAAWAAVRGHPALAGVAIGLAADAKGWALVFLPVLLLSAGIDRWRDPAAAGRPVRENVRSWVIAGAWAAVVFAAAWAPFFLADPATTNALHFQIDNLPASALRALGVTAARTPPWDRPAQIALGCLLGTAVVIRRRWPAVLLLGAGARIVLDPAVHSYYTPEVLLGAVLWDLLGSRRPFPAWTVVSFAALNLVPLAIRFPYKAVQGDFRLALVAGLTLFVLFVPDRWTWRPAVQATGPDLAGPVPGAP